MAGSVVYDAIQDKDGFMWFATENGLSRFDGKNFTTFTTRDGLPDNEVLKLFPDSKGRLWIMPFKPSLCYYYQGKIYNKGNDSLLSKIKLSSHAFDMVEDKFGNLVITEMTAWHTVFNNGNIRTVNSPVYAVGLSKDGEAQLLTVLVKQKRELFYIIHSTRGNLQLVKNRPDGPDASSSLINPEYTIIPSRHSSHLSVYHDTSEIISTALPLNTVNISYIDKGNIIINTTTGIKLLDPQKKVFSDLLFKDFSVTSGFRDKENDLWLTTAGSGVLMVPSFECRNYSFRDDKKNPEVTALYIKKDTLYAGGWGKKILKLNVINLTPSFMYTNSQAGKIISIVPNNKQVFLAYSEYTRNPLNPAGKTVPELSIKSAAIGNSGIIFSSHKNALLCKWSGIEEPIWQGRTTCAIEKDSGFYIGTLNGLFFKTHNGKVIDLAKLTPVFSSRIVNLAVSHNGVLWVITKGNGVAAYSHDRLLFHFTEANGLTSDNCTSIYIDRDTTWVGTEKGLNRIETSGARSKITHFSMSDGLPSDVINAIVAVGRKVFVGTPKGLTYFEVDKISQTSTCDLQMTGIYVGNKYWAYDSTSFSLPHKDNDIRFEFSGISFRSAGDMTYKYRLLGMQPKWRTTTEKQLSFPSLSSGKYYLQLKVINKYGIESNVKEVSFVIEKLLWEKTWFRALTVIMLVGIVWASFRYRIKKIKQKQNEQIKLNQHVAELEQNALRSQMNPHFIFNCLNSIHQYVAERDIAGANNFITDFSRLIRMTLDFSTNTVISLSDEIDYISTYLRVEKARLEDQFQYCIDIDEGLDLHQIYLPPLLLQPYIENSIRHGIKYKPGRDGLVQVTIQRKKLGVLISIQDNGVGREAASKYKSKYHIQYQSRGMTINEDRIKILNSSSERKIELAVTDLYDSENRATGTRVDVYLP